MNGLQTLASYILNCVVLLTYLIYIRSFKYISVHREGVENPSSTNVSGQAEPCLRVVVMAWSLMQGRHISFFLHESVLFQSLHVLI